MDKNTMKKAICEVSLINDHKSLVLKDNCSVYIYIYISVVFPSDNCPFPIPLNLWTACYYFS
jgi:hypothetical protein